MRKTNLLNHVGKMVVFVFLLMLATFTSCKKDQTPVSQEVSFNLNSVSENGGLKSTNVICTDLPASYVKYKLGSDDFKSIPVFYVNGLPWTSSIKLNTGTYTLNEFLVYNDNNTPNDLNDDILISATPHIGSEYATFCKNGTLAKTFTVGTDLKTEVKIDVVCFVPENFVNFGFAYFQLNELTVRQVWFFGDFCIKSKGDYAGSLYTHQANWGNGNGFIDAPAIFQIEVWKNGTLQNTFNNGSLDSLNFSNKLSVTYGDYKNQVDNFEFKLYILVKQGILFNYVYFKSWTFADISTIPTGADVVTDFVLGSCYDPLNPPDLILAPYMNLPLTATYQITGWNPSSIINGVQGYVDATLSTIGSGYDIHNGLYASNCADHQTTITVGTSYNMNVYSSLYQDKLPVWAQSAKWNKINWLYNNLNHFPGYHWYDIQGAIWMYDTPAWNGEPEGGFPSVGVTATMLNMKTQMDLYGANYYPLPGGWAAIIFIYNPTGSGPTIQTMFVRIDP